jgi:hypothetical protein
MPEKSIFDEIGSNFCCNHSIDSPTKYQFHFPDFSVCVEDQKNFIRENENNVVRPHDRDKW